MNNTVLIVTTLFVILKPCFCEDFGHQLDGGAPTSPFNYQWFTAMEENGNYICSGAYVGPVHVLTAAHCVRSRTREALRAVVSYFCPQDDNCNRRPRNVKEISEIELAPRGGDLAILILNSPVTLDIPYAVPDVLAPAASSFLRLMSKNDPMILVGAGRAGTREGITDSARQLILSFQKRKWCKKQITSKANRSLITKNTICSRGVDGQPCRGDSGAAVIVKYGERDIVMGIHSLGPADCSTAVRRPLGHFAVNSARDFMLDVICNHSEFPAEDWCPAKVNPTQAPIQVTPQTLGPSRQPTRGPTIGPTIGSTIGPTIGPTSHPASAPTSDPTRDPTRGPTNDPTLNPTRDPATRKPTRSPVDSTYYNNPPSSCTPSKTTYFYAVDTVLDESQPTSSFSSVSTLAADQDDPMSKVTFLKFPEIAPDAVPSDAFMITGVVLWIRSTNGSAGPIYFNRILRSWSESITWDSRNRYFQPGDIRSEPSVTLRNVPSDWISINVEPDVRAWLLGGEQNHGWMISTPSNDGLFFDSSEVSDPYNQPQLFVTFACSTPPSLGGPVGATEYNSPVDTTIEEEFPRSNLGGSYAYLTVYKDNPTEAQALLKFDQLPRSVPLNTRIKQAILWVYATSASDGPVYVHRMLQSWSEYSTWNSFGGNGVQNNNIEAVHAPSVVLNSLPGSGAWMSFHVEGDVSSWVLRGNPNHGWVFITSHWDDFEFYSSECPNPDLRPILYVTFG